MDKLIEIDKITAAYGNKVVLKDVSLTVWKDDFLGIIGPNGGGKTTLLKVILGLLQPVSGSIRFYQDGVPVSSLRIGYLPQLNNIDRKFPISVWEVIASGLAAEKPRFRSYTEAQKQRIDEVIRQMGLEDLYTRSCPAGAFNRIPSAIAYSGRTEFVCRQAVRVAFLSVVGRDQ